MSKLFFVFPNEIAKNIIKRIEKEMEKYLEFFKEIHFDCTFYMNIGKYFTHQYELVDAKIYLQKTHFTLS
ncbi:hypothetical protein MCOL2_17172 [Listeria fleischmannii FSL S10-1203]|uniref:Uncharacterized protein n=1 Tax=Listeria fleischmannii FSL S10-1203 TaxID=1265822 RepID=W7DSP3_9LIST|nr:hypothetical protein MCOL2_17172 [Listeria fleischmannii FSL S10-1203]